MVKCAECGFLALRNRVSRELVEVEGPLRQSANAPMPRTPTEPRELYERTPLCFARARQLQDEVSNDDRHELLRVFQRDRDCPSFTTWQQGFTPKEHRDMLDRQWLLEREERRDKEQRQWQTRQRIIDLVVLGLIATLVAGGFTVLGAFIERGSFP